jgi:ATP-binding cassette subfamily B protein
MDSLLDTVQHSKRINFSTELLAQGIRSLFTILLLWKGGEFVMHEALSIGELFALFALYGYFSGPIAQLVQANQAIQSARIASERLHDILDQETEEPGQSMPKALQKEISIQQVGFRFGFRKSILEGVDLSIPLGSFTGIVGESGSGKSTLLKLCMKIYTPQSGKILWDDEDIQTISGVALRKKMAFVPQEIELFDGNFYSNIALGDANPNLERIRHVAEITGLQDIIERLPHGYETGLGENGMALSGGQKQRLGIARAFYLLPEVILLDEATAWLDSAAERKILQLIRSQIRTVVCISHRLTQFEDADCIHVIQAGTVVESGTHADLMQKVGAYFNLYSKQNGELV